MITENQLNDAIKLIREYYLQNPKGSFSDEFTEWREKYFKVSIRIQSHQSKSSGRRYANNELYRKFKKSRNIP